MKRLFSVFYMFAISCVAADTASAGPIISTPTGLNPGDHFRIAFVTTDKTTPLSSDITTYDSFVTSEAGGATYNGQLISWQAIASTSAVNAIDHIGVTNDRVYLVDGTLVSQTDSTSGLWSGSLAHSISEDINSNVSPGLVWTGTISSGHGAGGQELGSGNDFNGIWAGASSLSNAGWISFVTTDPLNSHLIYGISSELTVPGGGGGGPAPVPEPSTAMLAVLGGVGLAIAACRKRRIRAGA